jgi:hypothetical protein
MDLPSLVAWLCQKVNFEKPAFSLFAAILTPSLPACDPKGPFGDTVGRVAGFSLHAGVAAKARESQKLERLCRYISRPEVSEKRLSLTSHGNIRYQLKTPYRDGMAPRM